MIEYIVSPSFIEFKSIEVLSIYPFNNTFITCINTSSHLSRLLAAPATPQKKVDANGSPEQKYKDLEINEWHI